MNSKSGTRLTLSDRFKMIRQEQQKRKIHVNPLIESGQQRQPMGREMNNFNGTVSRQDRPSAFLHQGSERNRRLVLQMAANDALMNEIYQMTSASNVKYYPYQQSQNNLSSVSIPIMTSPSIPTTAIRQQPPATTSQKSRLSVQQRLKQPIQNRLGSSLGTGNIKSRLGVVRKPISQRLGVKHQTLKARGRIAQKSGQNGFLVSKNNALQRKSTKNKTDVSKGKPKRITNRKGNNKLNKKPKITAERLDEDLESYMKNHSN